MRFLPTKFHPENLVIIKMKNSKLEKLWEGDSSLTCLKEMNLWGSKDLKEIPDLSRATNLGTLDLEGCSSLVELPSTIRNLNKLIRLDMSKCTNLETLPSGINLLSLSYLNLSGCSLLKSFPDISRNVFTLYLSHTAIEEIPWWIESFNMLKTLFMESCSKLKYVSISTLKYLWIVDFSDCGALVEAGRRGYPNGVAMKTDKIHTDLLVTEEAFSPPDNFVPKVTFRFFNCFDLNLEALLQQHSVFEQLIFSCEEIPLYFTHKATETSLTIPLLQSSLSQPFFRIRACAVIVHTFGVIGVRMKIYCRFRDRLGNHFDSPDHQETITAYKMGTHLFVFDYCFPLEVDDAQMAELNYDHVDIQFHFPRNSASCKLKEWGIRLLDNYTSVENQIGDPNTLSHVFEAHEDNMINEIEHSEQLGTCASTPSPDSSSFFEDVGDEVMKRNRDCETEEEHRRTSKRIKIV